jgi:hypothetical protein
LDRPRTPEERIAIFIPKWEIETWLEHLSHGRPVDESYRDYPKFVGHERDCYPAADHLVQIAQGVSHPQHCSPSLQRALESEYPRLRELG